MNICSRSTPIILAIILAISGCEGMQQYVKNDFHGTSRTEKSFKENIPLYKNYKTDAHLLRKATLEVLDEKGYIYEENSITGAINTEPKLPTNIQKSTVAGETYSAKLFIKLNGSKITLHATFDKNSDLTMRGQNIELPEKENELRKDFFNILDNKLGVNTTGFSNNNSTSMELTDEKKQFSMTATEMQKRLLDSGYNPGPVDGIVGKRTIDALKKFQSEMNLPVTGNLDSDTITRLRN